MAVLTWHNTPSLKYDVAIPRIKAHIEADAVHAGSFDSLVGGRVHRCAVGCSLRDLSDKPGEDIDWHAEMERVFGIPEWLAALEDRVFEGMPEEHRAEWPLKFAEAVPVGADLSGLADRLAVRRLREECLPLQDEWPDSVRGEVVAAIELCIAALEGKGDRGAAWNAAVSASVSAESVESWAAWNAAVSASKSMESSEGEWAAWTAAMAAVHSAVHSAGRGAASAAYLRESYRMREELERVEREMAVAA